MMTMKSGMKWFIGVSFIVIGICLLLPFAFGFHTQYLLKQLDGLRVPIRGGEWGAVEFSVSDQKRGWWHSSATVNLNYHIPDGAAQTPSKPLLSTQTKISHGPFLWRPSESEKRPFWGQAWIEAPVSYVTGSLPARFLQITGTETGKVRGYIGLTGNQTIWVNTNEVGFQDADGQLNFSGLALEIERSANGNELVSVLSAPHFNFVLYPKNTDGPVQWLINGIQLQFSGRLDHPTALWYGTWFGKAEIAVDTVQLDAGGQHYAVNKFSSTSVHAPGNSSDEMQGETKFKLESLTANQNIMGPLEADITYAHIDRDALEDMRKLYDGWMSADTTLPFIAYLTPAEQDEFYQDLFTFVKRKPTYKLDHFILTTNAGMVSGNFEANITAPAKDAYEVKNIEYWQQHINARLDITASQAVAENVAAWGIARFYAWLNPLLNLPQPPSPAAGTTPPSAEGPTQPAMPAVDYHAEAVNLLNQAQTFGFISSENQKYQTEALYQEGILSINGKNILDLSGKASTKQPTNPPASQ
jgi:uncharacterized protein YdgA (DUF945 family)